MRHTLTIGRTESGKTMINKIMCGNFTSKGINALVLDPLNDPGWPVLAPEHRFRHVDQFMAYAKQSRTCALFIDESKKSVDRYNSQHEWITTMSRHWGHRAYLMCQRLEQIAPNVRDMCGQMFLFRVSDTDARTLANGWSMPVLRQASSLPQFHFYHCTGFDEPKLFKVIPGKNLIVAA